MLWIPFDIDIKTIPQKKIRIKGRKHRSEDHNNDSLSRWFDAMMIPVLHFWSPFGNEHWDGRFKNRRDLNDASPITTNRHRITGKNTWFDIYMCAPHCDSLTTLGLLISAAKVYINFNNQIRFDCDFCFHLDVTVMLFGIYPWCMSSENENSLSHFSVRVEVFHFILIKFIVSVRGHNVDKRNS